MVCLFFPHLSMETFTFMAWFSSGNFTRNLEIKTNKQTNNKYTNSVDN